VIIHGQRSVGTNSGTKFGPLLLSRAGRMTAIVKCQRCGESTADLNCCRACGREIDIGATVPEYERLSPQQKQAALADLKRAMESGHLQLEPEKEPNGYGAIPGYIDPWKRCARCEYYDVEGYCMKFKAPADVDGACPSFEEG
jgi:hypothetical protein